MIRFTWLQARTQTAVAFGTVAVVAIITAITGPHLAHFYNANVATCANREACAVAGDALLRNDKTLALWLGILVLVIPGLIGLFWGAPLVARELETGTYRLAWTQSVSRSRWLAVKVAVVALTGMAVAGLFSLLVSWWASPLDRVNANRFAVPFFDERGVVAIGYAAFAVTLGITVGLLIRRTVPAMATTLAAFVVTRLVTNQWLRRHFMAPLHRVSAIKSVGLRSTGPGTFSLLPTTQEAPNAWVYSSHFADKAGHHLTHHFLLRACPGLGRVAGAPPPAAGKAVLAPKHFDAIFNHCVTQVSAKFHLVTTYQPATRYWTFQWIELALYLVTALLLTGFCLWFVRRRLT
jgi:ABC-2 family transporter protein